MLLQGHDELHEAVTPRHEDIDRPRMSNFLSYGQKIDCTDAHWDKDCRVKNRVVDPCPLTHSPGEQDLSHPFAQEVCHSGARQKCPVRPSIRVQNKELPCYGSHSLLALIDLSRFVAYAPTTGRSMIILRHVL